jgi:hypothetical protein
MERNCKRGQGLSRAVGPVEEEKHVKCFFVKL